MAAAVYSDEKERRKGWVADDWSEKHESKIGCLCRHVSKVLTVFHPVCGLCLSSYPEFKYELKNEKQEVPKSYTSLQWHQILLSCFTLISSDEREKEGEGVWCEGSRLRAMREGMRWGSFTQQATKYQAHSRNRLWLSEKTRTTSWCLRSARRVPWAVSFPICLSYYLNILYFCEI